MLKKVKWVLAAMVCAVCLGVFVNGAVAAAPSYQPGRVLENVELESKILNHTIQYTIYLPPGYDDSTMSYPVIYMFHGGSGHNNDWIHLGKANIVMDRGIADGTIAPMVLVFMDSRVNRTSGQRTYSMNFADGSYMWSDMFHEELIPHIESNYRIRDDRLFRGIGGLSMGGYSSLNHTLRNLGKFSLTFSMSPNIKTRQQIVDLPQNDFERSFSKPYGAVGKEGEDRLTKEYYENNPIELAQSLPVEELKKMKLWLECGGEDPLYEAVHELHRILLSRGVPHFYRIRTGEHVWEFWQVSIKDAMEYATAVFYGDPYGPPSLRVR